MVNGNMRCLAVFWCVALALSRCASLLGDTKVDATGFRQAVAASAAEATFHIGRAEFVLKRIPAGEFDIGSPASDEMADSDEKPLRHIRISRAFYIGKTPVTQIQYREVMGHLAATKFKGDLLPISGVIYPDALKFCHKVSRLVGLKVTLPTEAAMGVRLSRRVAIPVCCGRQGGGPPQDSLVRKEL